MSRSATDPGAPFLPARYYLADRAASVNRRQYMRLVVVNLALVLAVADVAALSVAPAESRRIQSFVTAAAVGLSVAVSLAMTSSRYVDLWVQSRALAEVLGTIVRPASAK